MSSIKKLTIECHVLVSFGDTKLVDAHMLDLAHIDCFILFFEELLMNSFVNFLELDIRVEFLFVK